MTDTSALRAKLDEMVKAELHLICAEETLANNPNYWHEVATELVALSLLAEKEAVTARWEADAAIWNAEQMEIDDICRASLPVEEYGSGSLSTMLEKIIDAAKARAEKAEALVAMLVSELRRELEAWVPTGNFCNRCDTLNGHKDDCILSSTAPAAQEWEARIRKEKREAAWNVLAYTERIFTPDGIGAEAKRQRARAAILNKESGS